MEDYCGKVPKRQLFPFAERRTASETGRWFLCYSDGWDASPDLLHQFYGLLTPWASCLNGVRKEDVGLLKFLILCGLVVSPPQLPRPAQLSWSSNETQQMLLLFYYCTFTFDIWAV